MKGAYAPHEVLRDQTGVQADVKRSATDENRDAPGLNRHRARHLTRGQLGAANRQGRAKQVGDDCRISGNRAFKAIVRLNRAAKSCTCHFKSSHASRFISLHVVSRVCLINLLIPMNDCISLKKRGYKHCYL